MSLETPSDLAADRQQPDHAADPGHLLGAGGDHHTVDGVDHVGCAYGGAVPVGRGDQHDAQSHPASIRLIIQITIVASIVIVIDQFLQAFMFDMSKRLSIFVGLIVTNCLVLGRAEAFAMRNPVIPSVLDGLGNGLGYSLILIFVGTLREFFGTGAFVGRADGLQLLPRVAGSSRLA
jgi:hypothetical protein